MALSGQYVGEQTYSLTKGQRQLQHIQAGRKVPQWLTEKLMYVNANAGPFVSLLEKLGGVKKVYQASFSHLETDYLPGKVEVDGSQTSGDTSIEITTNHGRRVLPGYVLLNTRTDELIRVSSIAGDILTVTRGVGGTSAAAMNNLDELEIMGMADTEGNTSQNGISSEPNILTNYCQIFRQPVEISGRDMESENYGDQKELVRMMKDADEAIRRQREKAYLMSNGISSSDPYITAGLRYWVTTNVTNCGGAALDEATANTFIKNCMRRNHGARNTVFFAGENILDAFDGFARDNIRYEADDKMAGIAIGKYQNSHGVLNIVPHYLLSDTLGSGASFGRWGGQGFFVNLDNVQRAQFGGRGLSWRKNIELPGTDGEKHELLTDEGLAVYLEETHARIKGCTG
jgi:hypothetical protein